MSSCTALSYNKPKSAGRLRMFRCAEAADHGPMMVADLVPELDLAFSAEEVL